MKQLQLEDAADVMGGKLSLLYPKVFGGLWMDHTPEFHVTVALTAPDTVALDSLVPTELGGAVSVVQVPFSLEELHAAADALLQQEKLDDQGDMVVEVDPRAQQIVVRTSEDSPSNAISESNVQAALEKADLDSGLAPLFSFKRGELPEPSTNVFGGLENDGNGCTFGFAVYKNGNEGIADAAHCGNTGNFNGQPLNFQDGDKQVNQDVQWWKTPNLDDRNWVKDNSADGHRTIDNWWNHNEQFQGDLVCKYGIITGYDCGEIVGYTSLGWVVDSSSAFRVIDGDHKLNLPGDSGGPAYRNHIALGTMLGGYSDSNRGIYMPVNFMWEAGSSIVVYLQTGPCGCV